MRIECILLAAGFSRRYGKNKLLERFDGKSLWEISLHHIQSVKLQGATLGLTVVTQWPQIEAACRGLGVACAVNPHPETGIAGSLQTGLRAAPAADYYAFFVADQPRMTGEIVQDFLAAFAASETPLGAVASDGVPGNPCIFAARFVPELEALTGDKGGKRVLNAHLDEAFLYEVPAEALRDMDIPE